MVRARRCLAERLDPAVSSFPASQWSPAEAYVLQDRTWRDAFLIREFSRLLVMPEAPPFEEWCRRLKASDREAYAHVFETLYDPLFRYVRSITKEATSARDVTQDVFIRLWEVRESLDPTQSLEAYLYRMARNRAYNHERRRQTRMEKEDTVRKQSAAQPASPELPDVQAAAQRLEDRLQRWIDDLPDRQREALVLSRYEGLSHDTIAEVMDISPRTVNNHIVRALKQLRERIRAYEPDLLDRNVS